MIQPEVLFSDRDSLRVLPFYRKAIFSALAEASVFLRSRLPALFRVWQISAQCLSSAANNSSPRGSAAPRLCMPPSETPQNVSSTDEKTISLVGKRIVVVEDEGITQMQLGRLLRQEGLIVAGVAANGQEGVAAVLREQPDLVLMDIRMPVMDGLEATRQILSVRPVCIVMLTAFAEESFQEKARQIGASGYLIKPITGLTLLPQLQKAYAAYLASQPQN